MGWSELLAKGLSVEANAGARWAAVRCVAVTSEYFDPQGQLDTVPDLLGKGYLLESPDPPNPSASNATGDRKSVCAYRKS